MLVPDWAQKMLCIIVPNRRTVSPESFSWVRTRRLLSRHSCPILGDPGAVSRVGRKGGTKVFKYGRKSPWLPTLIELFPKIQANAGSWLGTKNALYYCAQSANSFFWVLFVSSYTTAIVLRVQGKLLFSTFLTRNEGTTDESKKRLGCYQQEQFNLPREYSVFDSSQYIVNNRKFKMRRRRESQKSNSLTRRKKLCTCIRHTFLYISLPSTARLPVKMPNQSCFVKNVNKQWQHSFSSWTWIWLIEIQLQKISLAFDKVSELE